MNESDAHKIHLSYDDSIEYLGANHRHRRCLLRAGIHTIRELVQLIEAGKLESVHGLGEKSAKEIEGLVGKFNLMGPRNLETAGPELARETTTDGGIATRIQHAATISNEVIAWQLAYIDKLIQSGLLNEEAKILGKSISYWVDEAHSLGARDSFDLLRAIISSSASICDELAYIFDELPDKYIKVLMLRYGYGAKTLEEAGAELGVTRQRVSQMGELLGVKMWRYLKLISRSRSIRLFEDRPAFLKIQTALLNAKRMGMKLCFSEWERSILHTGLVGIFRKSEYSDIDPIEAMIAVCSLATNDDTNLLRLPKNLSRAIELCTLGSPDLPARTIEFSDSFPAGGKRSIARYTRVWGGVNVKWLAEELRLSLSEVRDVVRLLGYREVTDDWFMPISCDIPKVLKRSEVFHRSVRKLLRCCGPLKTEDIRSGLEHSLRRKAFPVPPTDVMEIFLNEYGYGGEEGLFYWEGNVDEELSRGEGFILDFMGGHGPVVQQAELEQASMESEMSFDSLQRALTQSPLFERVNTGIYKLRGVAVNRANLSI